MAGGGGGNGVGEGRRTGALRVATRVAAEEGGWGAEGSGGGGGGRRGGRRGRGTGGRGEWRGAGALGELDSIVVIPRAGETENQLPEPFRGRVLRGQPVEISASDIRARLREGKSIEQLVPPGVAAALKTGHIY